MFHAIKNDIFAGFSVFLLALPLCLGIASASQFPVSAGILSAIVGGLIASWFGGAPLTIKGPAAGLIVIVFSAVTELGYEATLAVGVIAALLQIILGIWRKAIFAEVMPAFVIHGMLAAIGVIIVLNQLYVLLGVAPDSSHLLSLIINLPKKMLTLNPIILFIGIIAFLIALVWPKVKRLNAIPSTLIVLMVVIPMSIFLNLGSEHVYHVLGQEYVIGPQFLINMPMSIENAIALPDFSYLLSFTSLKYIIMFTLVGSIESLLTACAVDTMSTASHQTDLNRDLLAVGIGNLVSSLIGGLPMISEIVRSKANIDYGAQSSRSNFFHGLFMLLALVLFPSIISLIPLSALAALLIIVGLRLASPHQFIHAYHAGKDQLLLFSATFFVTLLSNLLMGILVGILIKVAIHVSRGYSFQQLLSPAIQVNVFEDKAHIQVDGPLTFLGFLKLQQLIAKAYTKSSSVEIDLNAVTYIDYTALSKLQNLPKKFPGLHFNINDNQQLATFYAKVGPQ